jgi:hypothetical protein
MTEPEAICIGYEVIPLLATHPHPTPTPIHFVGNPLDAIR